jgi:hypothetical protein
LLDIYPLKNMLARGKAIPTRASYIQTKLFHQTLTISMPCHTVANEIR